MFEEVVPREKGKLPHSVHWVSIYQVQSGFGGPYGGVGTFQDGQIKCLLATEIMIQHALVDAGSLGDLVDAGAAIALIGEFSDRGSQNGCARPLGIACDTPVLLGG